MESDFDFLRAPVHGDAEIGRALCLARFLAGQGLIVRRIVPHSPGQKNKIQAGDHLRNIDGRNAAELSAWEIRELLFQAGKTILLKVKSGQQVRDIQLPLRRNFEYPPKWKARSTDADDFSKSLQKDLEKSPR